MKCYPEFNFKICLFKEHTENKGIPPPPPINLLPCPKIINLDNKPDNKLELNENSKRSSFIPTTEQLNEVINRLKKTKNDDSKTDFHLVNEINENQNKTSNPSNGVKNKKKSKKKQH